VGEAVGAFVARTVGRFVGEGVAGMLLVATGGAGEGVCAKAHVGVLVPPGKSLVASATLMQGVEMPVPPPHAVRSKAPPTTKKISPRLSIRVFLSHPCADFVSL
jgi:hypothetical protein